MSAHGSPGAIFLPAGAGEITPRHALDLENIATMRAGQAPFQLGQVDIGRQIVADHMIGTEIFGEAKPVA